MIFAVTGLRYWTRTLWESTEGIRRARILTSWTGRFSAGLAGLSPATRWKGTLLAAMLPAELPGEEPTPHPQPRNLGSSSPAAVSSTRRVGSSVFAGRTLPAVRLATPGQEQKDRTPRSSKPAISVVPEIWSQILASAVERRLRAGQAPAAARLEIIQSRSEVIAAIGREFGRGLDGVQAPLGVLVAELRPAALPADGTPASADSTAPRMFPGPNRDRQRSTSSPVSGAHVPRAVANPNLPVPEQNPLHAVGLSTPASAPAPDITLSVTAAAADESLTRVFPPSASPSMPPLLADRVTRPPAFGLSASATRQATRSEDPGVSEEDLAELSGKIQLILREEARRHGIAIS